DRALGGPEQDLAPLRGRKGPPAREGVASRRHRPLDVGGARVVEDADEVAVVGGVAVLERAAGSGADPSAADVVAPAGRFLASRPGGGPRRALAGRMANRPPPSPCARPCGPTCRC